CEIFHDTDWSTRCDEDPHAPDCPTKTSSSSATSTSSTGGGGSSASAGSATATGSGGAGDPCAGVPGGMTFGGSCYSAATEGTPSSPMAAAACVALGASVGRMGHLVVLGSAEEQAFVTQTFLDATAPQQDAWIALSCDPITHP